MKKIFAMLLVVMALFSLTGCGLSAARQMLFYVDKSDWPDRVNGVDVFECFDGMMYAG